MPQRFRFEVNENNEWVIKHEAILNAQRCLGHSKNGQRCKRKCIIGFEYCPTHLESIKKLKIKTSTIPNAGKGLFVSDKTKGPNDIVFRNNDKIVVYNGVLKSMEQKQQQYGNHTAPYGMIIPGTNNIIDAGDKRGVASLVNHKAFTYANTRFKEIRENHRAVGIEIVAKQNIKNGSELFSTYGNAYRFNEPTRYSTKPYYPRR